MTEIWKTVPDWPAYEVSSEGRVRSRANGKVRYLSLFIGTAGYRCVTLCRPGKQRQWRVHQVMSHAFYGPCPEGMVTRHLNDDRLDNRIKNIAYGTPKDNSADARRNGVNGQLKKTHCKRQHPYDEANTHFDKHGRRRTCHRDRERMRKQAERAVAA